MSRGKAITEDKFNIIRELVDEGISRRVIADVLGFSEQTIYRICETEDWAAWRAKKDAYAEKVRLNRKGAETIEKALGYVKMYAPRAFFEESDDEPKAEITFRGDIIDLSRLSGIAAILGIEEVKKL